MGLFDFLTVFDWISPTAAFLQDMANGPSCYFFVDYDACNLSGKQIERLLKCGGVDPVWGMMVVSRELMFNVKRHQGKRALNMLLQAGVPVTQYGPTEE
jgi:hypothetical protein